MVVVKRMSQKDRLIARLKMKPTDFSIQELDTLMNKCGCHKYNRGRTSGSAIAYIHVATKRVLSLHSPHPQKLLKTYMVKMVLEFLQDVSEI